MSISTDLTVADVLIPPDSVPTVGPKTLFKKVLEEMTRRKLGIACVVGDDGRLLGIITDGDIRRRLLKDQKPFPALFADDALDHAVRNPLTVRPETSLVDAVLKMEERKVWDLPVVAADGGFAGLLHLHPAIKALLKLA